MVSFWGVDSLLGNKLVISTEDEACVFPFTGPRVWEERVEVLVSWIVSSDAEPGSSVLVVWTAVVVNAPLSARRVLVSGEGMKVG